MTPFIYLTIGTTISLAAIISDCYIGERWWSAYGLITIRLFWPITLMTAAFHFVTAAIDSLRIKL